MIDIQSETLLRLRKVPDWAEKNLGQRVHISTVHRWRLRGVRGVKLETVLIGGSRCTSEEALYRLFAESTAAADGNDHAVHFASTARQQKQAEDYLKSEGI